MVHFSRRQFLSNALAGTSALALASAASADPLGIPVGIQLYTVAIPLAQDVPGTLSKLHQIGYREVETAGFAGLSAAEFRKRLDDAGLACPSCHVSFEGEDWTKPLGDARALGARYAASSFLRDPQSPLADSHVDIETTPTMDALKRIAEKANRIGEAAQKMGLQYAYHNHNRELRLVDGKPAYDTLLALTDPGLVKFEIDCGWMSLAGYSPGDYMGKYPGRFRMLHVKDFVKPATGSSLNFAGNTPMEAGHGFVDYKAIFAAAKSAGIQHYFVEQEPPYTRMPPLAAAQVAYDYLHSISA